MPQSVPRLRTVFRACVVNAVREGEDLMAQLIQVTRGALGSEESSTRNIAQRNLASDALRLLGQHESTLVKAYPMALLEIFAEGPAGTKARRADPTGMDFGELSLVDDDEVQAQVELSRAQQLALHATDATLSELNGLVSAAQGLRRVQPERNPLRPENYIRALQQVIAETGVPAPVREAWMQHMRGLLGQELVEVYKRATQGLRAQGIQAVGYSRAEASGGSPRTGHSTYGGSVYNDSLYTGQGTGYGSVYGAPSVYGGALAAETEEALLTVGILRQMLAGGGDPYDAVRSAYAGVATHPPGQPSAWVPAPASGRGVLVHMPAGHAYHPATAVEALEDIAQLEKLVGRLSSNSQSTMPMAMPVAQRSTYGVAYSGASESPMRAAEVVARMVENIAQDSRLLPAVQRAVQNLEPAIRQLVRHDTHFFSDEQHPARRLLDELTQRSLAFNSEDAPGFSRFMRLINEVVGHLSGLEITSAAPFESVLKALQGAWEAQERKMQAQRLAQEQALLQSEQREMLAEKIAQGVRALPGADERVPAEVMEFAAGPWSDVVALAQVNAPVGDGSGDPGGYLAIVPLLFWSAQPELARADLPRLAQALPALLATLRAGLQTIDYAQDSTEAFLQRLDAWHQQALSAPPPATAGAPVPPADPVPAAVDTGAGAPHGTGALPAESAVAASEFVVGAWVELITNRRAMRTQLTWTSPHHTLFLFTAADGSTQSMTRRMRDKLAAEGALRVISAQPVVARAMDAMAQPGRPGKTVPRKSQPSNGR